MGLFHESKMRVFATVDVAAFIEELTAEDTDPGDVLALIATICGVKGPEFTREAIASLNSLEWVEIEEEEEVEDD